MPYVPGCQYDLFISYASENNRNGWVANFHEILTDELEQLLGRQFSREFVFFDKTKLRAGQRFPETLEKAAAGSAMLVPVLSPSYLSSDWCDRERRAFLSKLPEGAREAECLAPVLIRPVGPTSLTELLHSAQHTSFLQVGLPQQQGEQQAQEPWPAGSPDWTAKVKKFAFEVMQALQHLRGKCKPVFLGRALPEHDELRSLCAIELQKRHFRVGPEALYVLDDEGALRRDLRQAALSVHFIGGADASALQAIEIAAEVCAGATILYQPFGSETTDEERIWLADFERSPELKAAGKYQRIEGKTEQELIAVLEQEITRIRPPASGSAEQAAVAVICDQPDLELARMLWREIQERDRLAVSYPAFLETRSTSMQRMRSWKDLVKTCQALLVCWGQTHDPTLLESICQLAASASPDAPHEWYLTGPELDQKLQKFPGAICQQPDQFNYDALTGFLNLVRRRSAAP